jgi:hypothetical protein
MSMYYAFSVFCFYFCYVGLSDANVVAVKTAADRRPIALGRVVKPGPASSSYLSVT